MNNINGGVGQTKSNGYSSTQADTRTKAAASSASYNESDVAAPENQAPISAEEIQQFIKQLQSLTDTEALSDEINAFIAAYGSYIDADSLELLMAALASCTLNNTDSDLGAAESAQQTTKFNEELNKYCAEQLETSNKWFEEFLAANLHSDQLNAKDYEQLSLMSIRLAVLHFSLLVATKSAKVAADTAEKVQQQMEQLNLLEGVANSLLAKTSTTQTAKNAGKNQTDADYTNENCIDWDTVAGNNNGSSTNSVVYDFSTAMKDGRKKLQSWNIDHFLANPLMALLIKNGYMYLNGREIHWTDKMVACGGKINSAAFSEAEKKEWAAAYAFNSSSDSKSVNDDGKATSQYWTSKISKTSASEASTTTKYYAPQQAGTENWWATTNQAGATSASIYYSIYQIMQTHADAFTPEMKEVFSKNSTVNWGDFYKFNADKFNQLSASDRDYLVNTINGYLVDQGKESFTASGAILRQQPAVSSEALDGCIVFTKEEIEGLLNSQFKDLLIPLCDEEGGEVTHYALSKDAMRAILKSIIQKYEALFGESADFGDNLIEGFFQGAKSLQTVIQIIQGKLKFLENKLQTYANKAKEEKEARDRSLEEIKETIAALNH